MPDSDFTPKVFKIHRFQIGVNVLIQTLLVIVIVVAANYFAFRHYQRWDLSRNRSFTLAGQTKTLLGGLKSPAHFIVYFPEKSVVDQDLDSLLKEFQYASAGKVEVEKVDPNRDLARARELSTKYKFGEESVVIVVYENRYKVVQAQELVDVDDSLVMFNQAPTIRDFKGEQALASALMQVSETEPSKVYVLTGDGEPEITDEKLKLLDTYVQRQNLALESLTSLLARTVCLPMRRR